MQYYSKSPVIVFPSADLDAVVEGVVRAVWFNQGQVGEQPCVLVCYCVYVCV
jgi:acyl-CoA reductase-like NAD-dependent aldehyde dehydrogenase